MYAFEVTWQLVRSGHITLLLDPKSEKRMKREVKWRVDRKWGILYFRLPLL